MTDNEAKNMLKALGFTSVLAIQKKYFAKSEQDGIRGPKTDILIASAYNCKDIKHFKLEEFKCKCGGKYCTGYPAVLDKQLLKNIDYLRADSKKPIKIISGLRCSHHNKNVGGATSSRHMQGKAVDIQSTVLTPTKTKRQALVKRWKTFKQNRYAYSDSGNMGRSVHLDVK